jgi:hypothetical protein
MLIKCGIDYQVIPRTHLEQGDTRLRHKLPAWANLLSPKMKMITTKEKQTY